MRHNPAYALLAPYNIQERQEPGRDPSFHVCGPGQSGVYPWPTYDAAHAQIKRLHSQLPAPKFYGTFVVKYLAV